MQIIHLDAEHTVTGSSHLIKTQDLNIMVDCAVAQGPDEMLQITARWISTPGL